MSEPDSPQQCPLTEQDASRRKREEKRREEKRREEKRREEKRREEKRREEKRREEKRREEKGREEKGIFQLEGTYNNHLHTQTISAEEKRKEERRGEERRGEERRGEERRGEERRGEERRGEERRGEERRGEERREKRREEKRREEKRREEKRREEKRREEKRREERRDTIGGPVLAETCRTSQHTLLLGDLYTDSLLHPTSGVGGLMEIVQNCKPKQPQFPQPLLIRLVLQTLPQLRCPSLDTLQPLNVPLVVRDPKLNTVFEAAFQPLFPKPVALHGVVVTQVQDPTLGLVESYTTDLSPSIQPVQIPLQSLPTFKQINTPAQFGVICKLTEGALEPLIQIIDKDIKQSWPQH
ncbi:hypothetical protein QYF61_027917 [Mycteria americana]|uniref:Uncharacterized protein n=1 Tax=Mycteria americana TaxID=33587 RepID=A0AAN7NSA5_MYCAM|nr:hypothetical protein QYF61_027917 [Mycteria americana]